MIGRICYVYCCKPTTVADTSIPSWKSHQTVPWQISETHVHLPYGEVAPSKAQGLAKTHRFKQTICASFMTYSVNVPEDSR